MRDRTARGTDRHETARPDSARDELLSLMPDGGALLDASGAIIACNHSAAVLIGGGEPIGKLLVAHLRDCGECWGAVAERIEAGGRSETIVKLADGRSLLVSVRVVSRSRAGEARHLVVFRDLDIIDYERRQAVNPKERSGAFRFASDRKLRPDFSRQRQISPDLDMLMTIAERAVVQGARLLILGDSGVGKTELARHLHDYIADERAPFVHVNCGSIPESLFEAEMFGYERGAFTGALQSGRKGYIESADGGTLFLDEVGEVPLSMQSRLLKFLESGSIQRVGSSDERSVRVRVISATNRDLQSMVAEGEFRKDLYFRLAVVPVRVKSLAESPELIDEITAYFLTIINQNRPVPLRLSTSCRERLATYAFPGNVRELFNVLQQLSVVVEETAEACHLPFSDTPLRRRQSVATPQLPPADLKHQVRSFERGIIERAIAEHGSKRKAAEALGVDIGTIVRKTQVKH